MKDQRSVWARLRRGGIVELVGDQGRFTNVILTVSALALGYGVGIGFMGLARWSGAEFAPGEIWLGGVWFAIPTALFGVRYARRHRRVPQPSIVPAGGTAGAGVFLGGAAALAAAQWAVGGARFVLWVVGLALVTIALRTGVEKGRSRAFNRVAALGVGIWLASVVLHAASR